MTPEQKAENLKDLVQLEHVDELQRTLAAYFFVLQIQRRIHGNADRETGKQ